MANVSPMNDGDHVRFPMPQKGTFPSVYLEDTDTPLPPVVNPKTRYAYFQTIARGGKSLIKTCKDLHLSRVVVYKTLKPEFADDSNEQRRFLREARVSAMLQHPNTMPTYEVGRDNRGHYYFTMKLVHGYTLRELLNYRELYDLTQLIEVLVQVARALEYAHQHGVIHRDVKPENVLVGPFGEVLLLDWGLAKVWNVEGVSAEPQATSSSEINVAADAQTSITGQQQLIGTAAYMSPEQIDRVPDIDGLTDVYSLGIILYEVLAGRLPHEATQVDALLAEIREAVPKLPSEHATSTIPTLLENLCMRCISKERAGRPDGAQEVIRVLLEDWR